MEERLISLLAFVVIALLSLGIFFLFRYRDQHQKLIHRIKQVGEEKAVPTESNGIAAAKRCLLSIAGSFGQAVKPKKEGEISLWRKRFVRAGYRGEKASVIFFGIRTFLVLLLPAVFVLLRFSILSLLTPPRLMFLLVILALIGFYLPDLWLRLRTSRRRQRILEGFPEALDLMVVCVEAGVGLDAAIKRVGDDMSLSNRVLGEEFELLSLELRAGKPRKDALKNLAFRTDLEDVSSLVTLLIQTEQFGTSIAQALRVHSDSMRTKRFQKAEDAARKPPKTRTIVSKT